MSGARAWRYCPECGGVEYTAQTHCEVNGAGAEMIEVDPAIADELLRLATADPEGFCELLHEAGMDLKGAVYRDRPSPFARAAREAGFAMAEVALRYARVADEAAEVLAEAAGEAVPVAA